MLNGIYPFCTRFYNGASCYGMHGWLKAVLKFTVQQGALKPEESEKQARNLGAEVRLGSWVKTTLQKSVQAKTEKRAWTNHVLNLWRPLWDTQNSIPAYS